MANRLKISIPKLSEWSKAFKISANQPARATLANLNVAESALSKLTLPNKKENMTAVELYPGLGVWTAALVNSGFKNVIALENTPKYTKHMSAVAESSVGIVNLLKKDGYDWETYVELRKPEYLGNLINTDWSKVHDEILFTGTLPKSVKGEQLLAQFASCINNKMAMHANGRIMMAMWVPDQLYHKFTAPPGSNARCKMSIVIEACAKVDLIASAEPESMYPNQLYHFIQVTPLEQTRLKSDWDVFEYVLKHLFVNQKKPLSKTISQLGPGANILIPRLSFDPSVLVVDMTVEQIDEVAMKFDQWPLRPRNLFDSEMVL